MRLFIETLICITLIIIACLTDPYLVKGNWTKTTDKKVDYMVENGMKYEYAVYVTASCKNKAKNPAWCVDLVTFLFIHEGSRGKSERAKTNQSPFGINAGKIPYQNRYYAFDDFLRRYNKYWFRHGEHSDACRRMVSLSHYTVTARESRVRNCYVIQKDLNSIKKQD